MQSSNFIINCFKIIETSGSVALTKAVNMATYSVGLVTDKEIAQVALYVRGIQKGLCDTNEALRYFNEIIKKQDTGFAELTKNKYTVE